MRIALAGVTKRFHSGTALAEITASIPPGSIVAVLGANGAGKSTLLRLLATVQVPTAGQIQFDGEPLTRDRLDLRRRLAYLPEPPPIPPDCTPLLWMASTLAAYELHRPGTAERAAAAYDELDLLPLVESPCRTLSRGQVYKGALAALLVLDPELWLLDEPFGAGMDPMGAATLKRHMQKGTARGSTIVYTTQMVEVAERFSDYVLILDRGRLHAFAPVAELAASSISRDAVLERLFMELQASAPP